MSRQNITVLKIAARGLAHFRAYHISLFAGTVLSAMILTGALLVGDSVTRSLNLYAEQRLGGVENAINLPRRYVATDFAEALADRLGQDVAGVLRLRGSLSKAGKGSVPLSVNVVGVDDSFWKVAGFDGRPLGKTSVLMNQRVSTLMGVGQGEIVSLTVEKPSMLSRDAPLSSRGSEQYGTAALKVDAVLGDDDMGRFSLRAEQIPALNVFVNRERLQALSGLTDKLNMLLMGAYDRGAEDPSLEMCVNGLWRLEHSGYRIEADPDSAEVELTSDRIFIEPAVADVVEGARGLSAYLVNGVTAQDKSVPYSFILAGAGTEFVPADMSDDEVVINSWLADELGVKKGDSVRVEYFRLNGGNRLIEEGRSLKVRDVLEMGVAEKAKKLMPDFPGLSDVESCGDWDIGMPLDDDKVADQRNEDYWDEYRDTPKLFVTLATGRNMWGNHFGDITSFRFKADGVGVDGISSELCSKVDSRRLGLIFLPVAEQAELAVSEAMSFGGLFLSLSFFLIVAAILLTGLMFSFSIVKRSRELGVLRALGYSYWRTSLIYLAEAAAVALPGAVTGALLGMIYTKSFLALLNRFWSGAVAGSLIVFDASIASMVTGVVVSAMLVLCTVVYSVRRLGRKEAVELLSGRAAEEPVRRKSGRRWLVLGMLGGIGAAIIVLLSGDGKDAVSAFFSAGSLVLLAGLAVAKYWIDRLGSGASLSVRYVGLRNAARRHERSMAVVVLMALGCFMVFAVASMKEDPNLHAEEKWSGTGGFDLLVEFAIPVQGDVLTAQGLEKLGFREADGFSRSMVARIKVHDGDDASCLNLNKARTPVVLGVEDDMMARMGVFGEMHESIRMWEMLGGASASQIPVLAGDNETIMWGLGMKAGETLELTDGVGSGFQAKLVGALPVRRSILQGRLLMAMDDFVKMYPGEDGYSVLLVDCPAGRAEITGRAIAKRMKKYGPVVTLATDRLQQLYAVENTYMAMFAALGGLGLLLGAVGVGIVATLNILQRRSELALLRAVGYRRVRAGMVIFSEYAFLFVYGVAIGVIAAMVAVWPNVRASGTDLPFDLLLAILLGTLATGLVSIAVAGWLSLRGPLIGSLRSE